jgi:hypothetical protein
MRRILFSLPVLSLIFSSSVRAADDAGLPGEFLNVGVGARPLGMGRAFTGVADDVDAVYWNPAGLSNFRSNQLTFQYSPLPVAGSYQYMAYAQPVNTRGSIGLSIINLESGKLARTTEVTSTEFAETGDYDAYERAYLAAYAHRFTNRYASGLTLKAVENSIDDVKESGYGADWGNMFSVNENLQFGAMVRNIVQPTYKFNTEKETFPRILRAGGSFRTLKGHLLTALDVEKAMGESQNPRFHLGFEGHVIENIFFRAGIDQTELTTGVGIKFKNNLIEFIFKHMLQIRINRQLDLSSIGIFSKHQTIGHKRAAASIATNRDLFLIALQSLIKSELKTFEALPLLTNKADHL